MPSQAECGVRTWSEVAEDYEKTTGEPISRVTAWKIGQVAERKFRRGLLQIAIDAGVVPDDFTPFEALEQGDEDFVDGELIEVVRQPRALPLVPPVEAAPPDVVDAVLVGRQASWRIRLYLPHRVRDCPGQMMLFGTPETIARENVARFLRELDDEEKLASAG